MVYMIAAMDNNKGIGYNNQLLFNIPEDMAFFKEKTKDNVVIMGRRTWDSLPTKPLPNRTNIIITSKVDRIYKDNDNVIFMNIDDVAAYVDYMRDDKDIYIIGGASIYNYFICYCDKIYITRIYVSCVHVDTYFPEQIDNLKGKPISEIKTHKGLFYQFWEYTY